MNRTKDERLHNQKKKGKRKSLIVQWQLHQEEIANKPRKPEKWQKKGEK